MAGNNSSNPILLTLGVEGNQTESRWNEIRGPGDWPAKNPRLGILRTVFVAGNCMAGKMIDFIVLKTDLHPSNILVDSQGKKERC
jgi:hypothetical protein